MDNSIPPGSYPIDMSNVKTTIVDVVAAGLQTTIVPVMFNRNGVVSTEGTAFAIAAFNGQVIYVTASHVVANLEGADVNDTYAFVPLPSSNGDPHQLHGVRVDQITLAATFSDVSLLVVNPSREPATAGLVVKTLPLTLARPVVGERFLAQGYPQQPGINKYQLTASEGFIEELYPRRRDVSGIPYPSFLTGAKIFPSMSGGPILNTKGHVIGVVSRGFKLGEGDSNSTEYGACIASIIEHKVDVYTDGGVLHELSVPELVARKAIQCATDHRVELVRDEDGVLLRWSEAGVPGVVTDRLIETGNRCPSCRTPLTYRVSTSTIGDEQPTEIGREGPSCWTPACHKSAAVAR